MSAQPQSNIDQLHEAVEERNFLYLETADSPLSRVDNADILKNIIDPTTGQPYEGGIVMEGEFASLGVLNNNNRIYTEKEYIELVEVIKKKIHSKKGVYGELEHPKGYATDYNNVSHKILDIWYDPMKKKVFGVILILKTPKGLIAQEIVKSGGTLGISARAGGKETKNHDGTITAVIRMMVTFDIVYHPGFTTAEQEYTTLNENHAIDAKSKTFTIYETNLGKLDELYESYIAEEDRSMNFIQWVDHNKLFESAGPHIDTQQEIGEQKLQTGETNNQQQVEQQLSDAVDQQLNESQVRLNESQGKFYEEMQNAQLSLGRKMRSTAKQQKLNEAQKINAAKAVGRYKKQGNSLYDGSAGFAQPTGGISGVDTMSQSQDNPDEAYDPYGLAEGDMSEDFGSVTDNDGLMETEGDGYGTPDEEDMKGFMEEQDDLSENGEDASPDPDMLGLLYEDNEYGLEPDFESLMQNGENGDNIGLYQEIQQKTQERQKMYERQFDTAQRKKLAKEGKALPDGSFPIVNKEDLKNAIVTHGLAKNKRLAKAWIMSRAAALGQGGLLPKSWKE
jgi:hypothetical protein